MLADCSLFGRCFFALDFLAGGLVDDLHRQADLAALVKAQQLDPDLVAFLDDVGGLGNAGLGQLGDVHEAILGAEEVHERAEIGGLDHGTLIDGADFGFVGDRADPLDGGFNLRAVRRGDLDRAVVFDVDLGAGLFDDLADHLAAGADHFTDLVGRDLHGFDAGSELADFGTRSGDGVGHLAQDVDTTTLGLLERDLHDLLGDAGDLDVHLQRGDALVGTGDLEVHVAEVIFVAENVAENSKLLAFKDQAHGDTGNRTRQRHASIHQGERGAADGCHRGGAVGFGDLGHDTDRVGELFDRGTDRVDGAPGELAMADFATTRATHAASFTHRIGREVVVQQEVLLLGAFEAIDILLVFAGAEGGNDQRLGFAAGEQRRTVGTGQNANFGNDRADGREVTAVDAQTGVEHVPAHNLGLQ